MTRAQTQFAKWLRISRGSLLGRISTPAEIASRLAIKAAKHGLDGIAKEAETATNEADVRSLLERALACFEPESWEEFGVDEAGIALDKHRNSILYGCRHHDPVTGRPLILSRRVGFRGRPTKDGNQGEIRIPAVEIERLREAS